MESAEGSGSHREKSGIASPASGGAAPRTAGGASKYLANLPSRGLLSSTAISSNLGGLRVYMCDRDTSPPEEQLIKTNSTNILIRALQMNKQRTDSKDVTTKVSAESNKGKRSASRSLDSRNPAKKANLAGGASGSGTQEGSSVGLSERALQLMTVERLRAVLKERGLSPKGKKNELIARLKN